MAHSDGLDPKTIQQAVDMAALHGPGKAAVLLNITKNAMDHRLRVSKHRGIKPSKGILDPTDSKQLLAENKRLRHENAALHEKTLDEESIRREVFKLAAGGAKIATPDWTIAPRHDPSSPGVPTLFASDWHWAEVVKPSQINGVNEFNPTIAKQRVQWLMSSAFHLLKILDPHMRYPGIVMPLGGDMMSGNIHDELTATNAFNSMPTVLELLAILKWAIKETLQVVPRVFLPCVTGNHGRDTNKIWSKDRHATSFDWLLYMLLADAFKDDKRVTFQIPDGPDAYYRIYSHRYLLTHGDQFRGGDSMIGALGPLTRGNHKKQSRNAQIDMSYDTMICGHWHQYIHLTRLIVNGSLKGYDEYANGNNFGFEVPQQALWVTHPKYRITYRMPVLVDRQRAEPKTTWVSVAAT